MRAGTAGRFGAATLPRQRDRRPAPCCPPNQEGPHPSSTVATVALVGNPNVGKSTLFNALTGARQHVGNWPGKTVRVASGTWTTPTGPLRLVDLPGTYSLVPTSPDEELVRDLLADPAAHGRPDLVVAVLDAANLARNLYLLAQLTDVDIPVVVALTMGDVATARGLEIDHHALSERLGVPVVDVRPRRGAGLPDLTGAVVTALVERTAPEPVDLGPDVEDALAGAPTRWAALQRLTAGDDVEDWQTTIAERRYAWVHRIVGTAVRRPARPRPTASDRADRILISRWLGLPIFLAVMWGVFVATTRLAAPLQQGLAALFTGPVHDGVARALGAFGQSDTWFGSLVLNALLAGVGQLMSFVPLMAVMFVLLTLLEDSGYMARAAFVADRFLRLIGLPGRAFLPLIVGFGCNVPAIAGTRILPDARHRLLTGLLVPYVTCSARLTVYVLLANVVFGGQAGTVVFAMYLVSIALVILVGLALYHTVFRHQPRESLLLELPPYRRPTLRVVATLTWQKLAGFLRTASGIILATIVAVWLLAAVPLGAGHGGFGNVEPGHSLYAGTSRVVSTVFTPAGFGDWHTTGALITGFVAKEAVVSTFAETYGAAKPSDPRHAGDLGVALRGTFNRTSGGHAPVAVLAFLIFLLAYTPCMATVAAQRAEIGGRWTLIGIGMQLAVAWTLATLVFQIGRLVT